MSRDVGTPPAMDFADAMGSRYAPEPEQAAPAARQPAAKTSSTPGPEMTRRSWLLPRQVADELTAAADRIHHASLGQVSKSEAQAALIRDGVRNEDTVRRAFGLPPQAG